MNSKPNRPLPPTDLTTGSHLTAEDGACLMEWVSVLAGEQWSDTPAATHPLLAHLGRLVNDAMSPQARTRLLPLAPRLAELNSLDPALHARLAELVTGYALGLRPGLGLAWMHRAAQRQRRLAEGRQPGGCLTVAVTRARQAAYRRGPAYRALEVAVRALCRTPDPDDHLVEMFEQAIRVVEHARCGIADNAQADRPARLPAHGPSLTT